MVGYGFPPANGGCKREKVDLNCSYEKSAPPYFLLVSVAHCSNLLYPMGVGTIKLDTGYFVPSATSGWVSFDFLSGFQHSRLD